MLYDFFYNNPTRVHFGADAVEHLAEELKPFGPTVLLCYGGGSVKRSGLYDRILSTLSACGKRWVELTDVRPNPSYQKALEGADLARREGVDLILAVGGGSVIDCAKAISVMAREEGDCWRRYWIHNERYTGQPLPVGAIPTMVGTGSEMNGGSVLTNTAERLKVGHNFGPVSYPRFALMDPTLTYTLPRYQMVSGAFDAFSHLCEQYFSGEDDNVTDYIIEGVMRSLLHATPQAIRDPQDYEARSNLMWAAVMALNTITGLSKKQDWQVHKIEHQLGAYTDCAHGMGLSALTIPYFRLIRPYAIPRFCRFAVNVFGVDPTGRTAEELSNAGIDALAAFIRESGMATTLKELGAAREQLGAIADSTLLCGSYKKLTRDDVFAVLNACYE